MAKPGLRTESLAQLRRADARDVRRLRIWRACAAGFNKGTPNRRPEWTANQITRSWKRLIAKVASPPSETPAFDLRREDPVTEVLSSDDRYDDGKISPYIPDNRSERTESSSHMSC